MKIPFPDFFLQKSAVKAAFMLDFKVKYDSKTFVGESVDIRSTRYTDN